jgi:hypothetical protein
VIVHPDRQWDVASNYLECLRAEVPEEIRENFVFHATELFSGGKIFDRKKWDKGIRWPILKRFLAGPRLCNLPVALSFNRKQSLVDGLDPKQQLMLRHGVAFLECLKAANAGMKRMFPGEKATIIAEDHPTMRRRLSQIPEMLRDESAPEAVKELDPFDAIVNAIHFTNKQGAPLLQMADAVAFAVRHYLSGHTDGLWLMQALTGYENPEPAFATHRGHTNWQWLSSKALRRFGRSFQKWPKRSRPEFNSFVRTMAEIALLNVTARAEMSKIPPGPSPDSGSARPIDDEHSQIEKAYNDVVMEFKNKYG